MDQTAAKIAEKFGDLADFCRISAFDNGKYYIVGKEDAAIAIFAGTDDEPIWSVDRRIENAFQTYKNFRNEKEA